MKKTLIFLLMFASLNAWATKYYVDPAGVDDAGRSGIIGQEWATPAYACTRVSSPDTVFINAGTYNQGSTQIVKPLGVHIMGVGDASHIISIYTSTSSSQAAIQCASTAGTTTDDGGSISYIRLTGSNLTSTRGIYVGYRNNVAIHHVTLEDFLNGGIWLHISNDYLTLYASGNSITDCVINNCAQAWAEYQGAIRTSGQTNCDVLRNIIDMTERPAGDNGSSIEFQRCKKIKIDDNIMYRLDHEANAWNFFFEGWDYSGDLKYTNNTHYGLGLVSFGGEFNKQDIDCTFGGLVADNKFYNDAVGYRTVGGIVNTGMYAINMEGDNHVNFTITRNYIQNYATGIELSTPTSGSGYWAHYWNWDNISVTYNVIDGVGYQDFAYTYGIWWINESNNYPYYGVFNNVLIANNTIIGYNNGTYPGFRGIGIYANDTINDLRVSNNIVKGFSDYGIYFAEHNTDTLIVAGLDITYNDMYANGTNTVYVESAAERITITDSDVTTGNITTDPLFKSTSDFHLQSTSPCIDAGLDVSAITGGLDFNGAGKYGTAYDIGAFEWGQNRLLILNDTLTTINYKMVRIDH